MGSTTIYPAWTPGGVFLNNYHGGSGYYKRIAFCPRYFSATPVYANVSNHKDADSGRRQILKHHGPEVLGFVWGGATAANRRRSTTENHHMNAYDIGEKCAMMHSGKTIDQCTDCVN